MPLPSVKGQVFLSAFTSFLKPSFFPATACFRRISHICNLMLARERARILLERIKEIFKKYDVMITAIFLADRVTIRAVIEAHTKALKAVGKCLGNSLKDGGAKIGSMLPGLIGLIVSFLFKTAGQVVCYLAGHTWLVS